MHDLNKWTAAWLLAHDFGHGWAKFPFPTKTRAFLRVFNKGKPAGVTWGESDLLEPVVERLNLWPTVEGRPPRTKAEAEFCEAIHEEINWKFGTPDMPGLPANTKHTTVSGRLVWECTEREVILKINRPNPMGENHPPVTVLKAVVPYARGARLKITQHTERKKVIDFSNPQHGVRKTLTTGPEHRHWVALDLALEALGFPKEERPGHKQNERLFQRFQNLTSM